MSYVASAAVRGKDGWSVADLDLAGVADVEEVADRLRDVDPEADVSLLFVEADETYLAILRLDQGENLRIFGSDSAFARESRLGALLLGDIEPPALEIDDAVGAVEGDETAEITTIDPEVDPVGDADLLADLGVPAHVLLNTCAREGMLPSDCTVEIARLIGCGDEMEELREA
ncbi:MAG: tRNA adenosine deaminase-associated protein [Micromonosporaceae bacterium]